MIKVLFISQWYPNKYDLMAGLFVQKHAQAVGLYCDVATLYIQPDKFISKLETQTTFENGILEIIVYYPANDSILFGRIGKLFQYLKAYISGFKTLQNAWGMPDLVQANIFTRTALIALMVKVIYGIPYTVIEHWTRYFREITYTSKLHKYLTILAAKYASAVLPVTHHLQKCMEGKGMKNSNYQVINNVVDNIYFKHIAKTIKTKIRIINVTCFDDKQKNLTGLLNVILLLSKKRQDFELYMVGDGVDFEMIKSYAKAIGLEDSIVHFSGLLTGEKLVEVFQQSHFSVLFSNYENIPVVISESLVCGKPVISTNVGGISEHINAENGILINAKDEHALFDAIDFMIDHSAEYDAHRMKDSAMQKYGYQSVGVRLLSIYKSIITHE